MVLLSSRVLMTRTSSFQSKLDLSMMPCQLLIAFGYIAAVVVLSQQDIHFLVSST
jgi:hypothetical protein